jgi:tRNA modification GTPase
MLGDTIAARASAAGGSERAVVRVSGPQAFAAAARLFAPALPRQRAAVAGAVDVLGHRVPAMALAMPGPTSFTGEDVVELHVPGSMALVDAVLAALVADGEATGVRLAVAGEFTARAVRNGRMDGAAAEGLLLLLHAEDARATANARAWLSGASADAAGRLRGRLQDALALLEAGLDFDDGEAGALAAAGWRDLLAGARPDLAALLATVPAARPGGEVLLLGAANAGKSSLANALAAAEVAIVGAAPGTTRDLVRVPLPGDGVLWDAPGDLAAPGDVDAAALALRERLGGAAAGCLVVLAADAPVAPASALLTALPVVAVAVTKCDLAAVPDLPPALAERTAGAPVFAASARTGAGVAALRMHLGRAAAAGVVDAGGPLRQALADALAGLDRALANAGGPELAALDLQAALRALDAIGPTHSPEQLLDRIYARFCLGK